MNSLSNLHTATSADAVMTLKSVYMHVYTAGAETVRSHAAYYHAAQYTQQTYIPIYTNTWRRALIELQSARARAPQPSTCQ